MRNLHTVEHENALRLHLALVRDWTWMLGSEVASCLEDDIKTIHSRSKTRGWGVLMEDLPSLTFEKVHGQGIVVDTTAAQTRIEGVGLVRSARDALVKGNPARKWLLGPFFEWASLNIQSGVFPAESVQCWRSIVLLFKKITKESSDESKSKAKLAFISDDESLPFPQGFWDNGVQVARHALDVCDFTGVECPPHVGSDLCTLVHRLVPRVVACLIDDIIDLDTTPKHGPGAVSDLRSGDKWRFPIWPQTVHSLYGFHGWGTTVQDTESTPTIGVACSKLICVPKTLNKPRVIASETTGSQYMQQALLKAMRNALSNLGNEVIDFRDQAHSQELAIKGSRDGSLATIDLSSASDLLSADLVFKAFYYRPHLLRHLRATRTQYCAVDAEIIALKKFAAMGSAVTFPVQTIIFTAFSLASLLVTRAVEDDQMVALSQMGDYWRRESLTTLLRQYREQVRVYGDDIIIPTEASSLLMEALEIASLRVNHAKSFSDRSSRFREACGMDAYNGEVVTPLYLRELSPGSLQNLPSLCDVRNNAYHKGYWHLASEVESLIESKYLRYLPRTSDPRFGIRLDSHLPHNPLEDKGCKKRWNQDIQVMEIKTLVVSNRGVTERRNTPTDIVEFLVGASEGCPDPLGYLDRPSTSHFKGCKVGVESTVKVDWVLGE